ncbi:helix-turn-helix domain-containing protein [Paracoccus methylarcula]|uniref:XRE family transcriptional regulator n=1 Tax=Paracoccus methylarcula TaxID=72022 RepID=A0A422QU84_9RHOB|nr:helix-turn-helix transcriptional regulator [Paracoccus methylarcula]RNF33544.1 XRE family transcriptional regulator [Paracoccus methylarcula]
MSVLEVFGHNLRNLTALRGSQAFVAQELDINRIQFQRYLRSESFPKPNVLKRICDYFEVDARILTDLLTPTQLDLISAGLYNTSPLPPATAAMYEAVGFCVPDQDFFHGSNELPDGVYQIWRGANSRRDCATQMLLRINTLAVARVVRGYNARETVPRHLRTLGRKREFRGMVLRQREGYTMLFFHSEPSRTTSLIHLRMIELGMETAATGFAVLARSEQEHGNRITRCLVMKVEGGWREQRRIARMPAFIPWEEVPEHILPFIRPQNETF